MFLFWAAWRYGGEDPYYLYNGPNASPSPHPSRLQTLKLAFGLFADEREREVNGIKVSRRQGLGG